jgi:hypothetical protein
MKNRTPIQLSQIQALDYSVELSGKMLSKHINAQNKTKMNNKLPFISTIITIAFTLFLGSTDAQTFIQKGVDINGTANNDQLGFSVCLNNDGNTMAVSAPNDDGSGSNAGTVRIYTWNSNAWIQKGTDIDGEAASDQSGTSVSLSSDGNTVAIGARNNAATGPSAGHVRIYSWNGSAWVQKGADLDGEAAVNAFGESVSLSSDGNIVAIGADYNSGNGAYAGHVRVFSWDGSAWIQKGIDIDGDVTWDQSGISVSLSSDGNIVAIGAIGNDDNGSNSGQVKIYAWNGSSWVQRGIDIDGEAADDGSGCSVSLSSDGNTVAIGAKNNDGNGPNAGHTRIYTWNGSAWIQKGSDIDGEAAGDLSGFSVCLSSDGNIVAIGAPYNAGSGTNDGHVRIYSWNGSTWIQMGADINGDNDYSGSSLFLGSQGNTVVIGAKNNSGIELGAGEVRVYELNAAATLNFDGVNDYISVLNNGPVSGTYTVEAWVRPNHATDPLCIVSTRLPGEKSFDMKLSGGNLIHADIGDGINWLTTSADATFNYSVGQWIHVAYVVTPYVYKIFANGVEINSVPFMGGGGPYNPLLFDATHILSIGAYSPSIELFNGDIDEVRIWNIYRSAAEIDAYKNCEISGAHPGLVANYHFNQGFNAGNNAAIDSLFDSSGNNYSGLLENFTKTGTTSNWVSPGAVTLGVACCFPTANSFSVSVCNSYTVPSGDETYTAAGSYTVQDTIPNSCGGDSLLTINVSINSTTGTDTRTECTSYAWINGTTYTASNNSATYNIVGGAANGCDSLVTLDLTIINSTTGTDTRTECTSYAWINGTTYTASNNSATYNIVGGASNGCDSLVTLDLTINTVDINVTSIGASLSADATPATYNWIDCDNANSIISGEINQVFNPASNGNYAVIITENNCVDTSACIAVTTIGVDENYLEQALMVYPNPSIGLISLELPELNLVVVVFNELGKVVKTFQNVNNRVDIELASGVYYIKVNSTKEHTTRKIVIIK